MASKAKKFFEDRVVELVRVKAKDLLPCPFNWRKHPQKQKDVLNGILSEVGIAGVQLVRKLEDGRYELIDGHLRQEEYPPEQKVPVIVLDVTEEEAFKLLATLDSSAALAETDGIIFKKLVRKFKTGDQALISMFSELVDDKSTKGLDLEGNDEGNGKSKKKPSADDEDSPDEDIPVPKAKEGATAATPASYIRMFQLFLNVETFEEFTKNVKFLQEHYSLENPTDTVLKAIRREVKRAERTQAES